MTFRNAAVAVVLALLVAGCRADQTLEPPASATDNDGLFRRYVSLGNSIAAGFQSGGINDSTQRASFAVLFARQAGTPFTYPSLAGRGCPAPLVNNVTETRVGNQPADQPCDLRQLPPPVYLNNLAVPGLDVADAFSNTASELGTYSKLTQFFLGGRTQVEWLMAERPTFVTVEIGPNDVLGAVISSTNPGDPSEVTPPADFEAAYRRLADSIAATGAKALLFTIPDVTLVPYVSTGSTYWCIKNQPACGFSTAAAFPPTFTVSSNCAPAAVDPASPGDQTLVPWIKGLPLIAAAAQGASTTLDCSVDADVILPSELATIAAAVTADNAVIADVAAEHDWAVFDINIPFAQFRQDGTIPAFPDISQALSGGSVTFGSLFSLDGFHPSSAAQQLIANQVIAAVNAKYGTAVPEIE
jgi:lysophospholipase L1-like esterase